MYFDKQFSDDFPMLKEYTHPVKKPARRIIGREEEIKRVQAALCRPELCNVLLLAEAGTGKTALVQGCMMMDETRYYIEVDASHMIADLADVNQMADRLKSLFDEIQHYCRQEQIQVVLFIDEFHQIVQLSAAAVEALKPLLADSGTRGIQVITATTYIEFRKWISPNQPLVERLQRINVPEPDKRMVVRILRDMAKRYGVDHQFVNDYIFEMIYDYTNRYIPANAQPRKSILVLDAMVGWFRYSKRRLNMKLLSDVIYESEGVNVAFRVNPRTIKKELDTYVFAQDLATRTIEDQLQVCVADLNDKNKPMSTLLFSGPTGVGKLIADYEMVPVYDKLGHVFMKRHGDLQVGDYAFDRLGKPTEILGTFPHKNVSMYRVTLSDGRTLDVGDRHLWTVCTARNRAKYRKTGYMKTRVMTTEELFQSGVAYTNDRNLCRGLKYFIPANNAVDWPEADLKIHPYVVGAFLGNGCMTLPTLTLSSMDEDTVHRVCENLGCNEYVKSSKNNYAWVFSHPNSVGRVKYLQTKEVFGSFVTMMDKRSSERSIPVEYMYSSKEQRLELLRGLFDTDGTVSDDSRVRVTYSTSSEQLAKDIQFVLQSLGIGSTIRMFERNRDFDGKQRLMREYRVSVKSEFEDKFRLFHLQRKLDVLHRHEVDVNNRVRIKKFDWIGISNIEYIGVQNAQCIYVDNPEHLYQAGSFIVTHNTEVCKQLARIMFGDQRRLIRFDMTEYVNEDSVERFRTELTTKVWERPYSIILLDEIEKACSAVTRMLLPVLDDGRLTDANNREISFVNSYIIMTTNAGSEVYRNISQYDTSDTGDGRNLKKYERLIRNSISQTTGDNRFPPELLGRIDRIVTFQPLSQATQYKIVAKRLEKLTNDVRAKHDIQLYLDERISDYLVKDNMTVDSDAGGARMVMAKLESEVVTAVSRFINMNADKPVKRVAVIVQGAMAHEDKNRLESQAFIVVKPMK